MNVNVHLDTLVPVAKETSMNASPIPVSSTELQTVVSLSMIIDVTVSQVGWEGIVSLSKISVQTALAITEELVQVHFMVMFVPACRATAVPTASLKGTVARTILVGMEVPVSPQCLDIDANV